MARSNSDEATFYFILIEDQGRKQIKGWSESKEMAEFYLQFHKSQKMTLKKMNGFYGDIVEILNENVHDEIHMYNILTRNQHESKRKKHPTEFIVIPATDTEIMFINDEMSSFMSNRIDYHFINACYPLLKEKYQAAINGCLLKSVMDKVVYEKTNSIVSSLQVDQLRLMIEEFSDQFGV